MAGLQEARKKTLTIDEARKSIGCNFYAVKELISNGQLRTWVPPGKSRPRVIAASIDEYLAKVGRELDSSPEDTTAHANGKS